jgi:hypothetical protein
MRDVMEEEEEEEAKVAMIVGDKNCSCCIQWWRRCGRGV